MKQYINSTRRRRTPKILFFLVTVLVAVGGIFMLSSRSKTMTTDLKHPEGIYQENPTEFLYSPFQLEVDPMERLLLINFEKDPDEIYVGFEPQVFDDDIHGKGLIVIAWRADGYVDVYHQPSVMLDPDTYDITGKGLADIIERPMEDAYFRVNEAGADAYFAFDDKKGRPIEVKMLEGSSRERKPFSLLAPMGSAAENPSSMPLIFLHNFYFIRRANTEVSIMVAGESRKPDTLPVPIDGSRVYFLRYTDDPIIATWNPNYVGELKPLQMNSKTEASDGNINYSLIENQGQIEIEKMSLPYKDHQVVIEFFPALPNIVNLKDGIEANGNFIVSAGTPAGNVSGQYSFKRQGESIIASVVPSDGWQPNERKLPVRFMYTVVSDFKNWPKTYMWSANINLKEDNVVTMTSNWERSNSQ